MQAGQLRHRITLQDVGHARTTRGGFNENVTVIAARLPAFVQPLSGTALMRAMQIDPRSRYSVRLRYLKGVTARLQLIYHAVEGDRTFEIVNVNNADEQQRELDLLCREAA